MIIRCAFLIVLVSLGMLSGCTTVQIDPLPCCNEGKVKRVLVNFVAKTTTQGSPDRWAAAGGGARFMGLVHHDGAGRE